MSRRAYQRRKHPNHQALDELLKHARQRRREMEQRAHDIQGTYIGDSGALCYLLKPKAHHTEHPLKKPKRSGHSRHCGKCGKAGHNRRTCRDE